MDPVLAAALGLAGVVVTALVSYFIARRQRSGKIDTTEAGVLWSQLQEMYKAQLTETTTLRSEVLAMRNEAITIRIEAAALREEAVATREEAVATRAEMAILREASATCNKELAELQVVLATLRPE